MVVNAVEQGCNWPCYSWLIFSVDQVVTLTTFTVVFKVVTGTGQQRLLTDVWVEVVAVSSFLATVGNILAIGQPFLAWFWMGETAFCSINNISAI